MVFAGTGSTICPKVVGNIIGIVHVVIHCTAKSIIFNEVELSLK
jgi:hypothetical protein